MRRLAVVALIAVPVLFSGVAFAKVYMYGGHDSPDRPGTEISFEVRGDLKNGRFGDDDEIRDFVAADARYMCKQGPVGGSWGPESRRIGLGSDGSFALSGETRDRDEVIDRWHLEGRFARGFPPRMRGWFRGRYDIPGSDCRTGKVEFVAGPRT